MMVLQRDLLLADLWDKARLSLSFLEALEPWAMALNAAALDCTVRQSFLTL